MGEGYNKNKSLPDIMVPSTVGVARFWVSKVFFCDYHWFSKGFCTKYLDGTLPSLQVGDWRIPAKSVNFFARSATSVGTFWKSTVFVVYLCVRRTCPEPQKWPFKSISRGHGGIWGAPAGRRGHGWRHTRHRADIESQIASPDLLGYWVKIGSITFSLYKFCNSSPL